MLDAMATSRSTWGRRFRFRTWFSCTWAGWTTHAATIVWGDGTTSDMTVDESEYEPSGWAAGMYGYLNAKSRIYPRWRLHATITLTSSSGETRFRELRGHGAFGGRRIDGLPGVLDPRPA